MSEIKLKDSDTHEFEVYVLDDDTDKLHTFNLGKLYGVITNNWLYDFRLTGVPEELVIKAYKDYNNLSIPISVIPKKKILYISGNENDFNGYMKIISIFNALPEINLFLFCTEIFARNLIQYINNNICIITDVEKLEANIIITYGTGAIHFIKQKLPVFIFGPYGYGGMVNKENLEYLIENGFMGRPGGNYQEIIPPTIVKEDLLFLDKIHNLDENLEELKEMVETFKFRPFSDAARIIKEKETLFFCLFNVEERLNLKPRIASNVKFVKQKKQIYVERKFINKRVLTFEKNESQTLKKMDGKKECRELLSILQWKEDQFWAFLYLLWEKKVIIF